MRWNVKPPRDWSKWHRWFAWYPVKVRIDTPADPFLMKSWVWLEWIDRKFRWPDLKDRPEYRFRDQTPNP